MADEAKRYLDYDGLAYLVERLTDRIQAAGSGGGTAEGVYVAYTDTDDINRIVKPDEWEDSGTPNGVLLVTGGRNLLVSLEGYGGDEPEMLAWGASGVDTGGYCTDEKAYALNDFDGRGNTYAVATPYDAVKACVEFKSGKVGAGKWWLPSLGELFLMYLYSDDINAVLSFLGMPRLLSGYYWSSTQAENGFNAWIISLGDGRTTSGDKENNEHYVRPVSDYVWKP